MQILDSKQIQQKIKRLAIQILEHNLDAKEIIFTGLNNNGYNFAKKLHSAVNAYERVPCTLTSVRLNPANPIGDDIELGLPKADFAGKTVIVVDDVANTGRTLFYAMKPLMEIIPKKIEIAVLVDRTHKSFPIHADYVGISLATTLKENIQVDLNTIKEQAVFLS